jgi:hypothetical protein
MNVLSSSRQFVSQGDQFVWTLSVCWIDQSSKVSDLRPQFDEVKDAGRHCIRHAGGLFDCYLRWEAFLSLIQAPGALMP